VFHALDAVLIPGKGVAAGRHLLQRGGEQADAVSMAMQANYDAQAEAIQWAATAGTPGSTEAAVQQGIRGNQLVALPGLDEALW
jgi:hypothetical protein